MKQTKFLLFATLLLAGCFFEQKSDIELEAIAQQKFEATKYKEAAETYYELISKFPKHPKNADFLYARGLSLYLGGHYDLACVSFEMFVKNYPMDIKITEACKYLFFAKYNLVILEGTRHLAAALQYADLCKQKGLEDGEFKRALAQLQSIGASTAVERNKIGEPVIGHLDPYYVIGEK